MSLHKPLGFKETVFNRHASAGILSPRSAPCMATPAETDTLTSPHLGVCSPFGLQPSLSGWNVTCGLMTRPAPKNKPASRVLFCLGVTLHNYEQPILS